MRRFTAKTVFFGLVSAWRLAIWPTSRSPLAVKPTIDGVVRAPSWLGMTWGAPPSITATQELVVPRSMPITFAKVDLPDAESIPTSGEGPWPPDRSNSMDRPGAARTALRDLHQRGPQQAALVRVAFPEDLDHRAVREARGRLVGEGLVDLGVEGLAHRIVHLDTLGLEEGE